MSAFKEFNSLAGDDKHPDVYIELALQDLDPDPTKSSLEPTNDSLPPVDGGTKAWSAIAGGFLALFVQFGLGNSYGAFQLYYSEHQLQNYSAQAISWIGSVQLFLTYSLATIVGEIFDTYGPRMLIVVGTILVGLSLILTSVLSEYHGLMIAHGVIFGIGSAMLYSPSCSVAGQWFVKKRATASGIVASGSSLGGVVFPILFSFLVGKLGFGSTLQIIAFICLLLLFIATFTLRSRTTRTVGRPDWFEPVRAARENAAYRWLLVGLFFGFWGIWSPFFFIGDFAIYCGVPRELSFYMLSIMNASSMLGRLVLFTADKVGRFNILIISLASCGVLEMALWPSVSTRGGAFAFAILFGFFEGGVIGCFPACSAQLSPPERIGSRFGFVLFIISFSTLTGPPLSGALLDHSIPESMYFSNGFFCGGVMFIGAFFVLVAKLSIDRRLFKVI